MDKRERFKNWELFSDEEQAELVAAVKEGRFEDLNPIALQAMENMMMSVGAIILNYYTDENEDGFGPLQLIASPGGENWYDGNGEMLMKVPLAEVFADVSLTPKRRKHLIKELRGIIKELQTRPNDVPNDELFLFE